MGVLATDLALVTGATGWLGLNLVRALAHGLDSCEALRRPRPGLRVRCLVMPGEDASGLLALAPGVEVVEGDTRNPADLVRFCDGAGGGLAFHLAGLIHPRRVADLFAVNVGGAANLMAAAAAAGLRRVVAVSSNSPCGANPHPDHLFDEGSPYRPYMAYGRSKMGMEQEVRSGHARTGVEAVIVRAPWFYGPFQPARQTLFFRMVRAGRFPIVGGGDNLRSMAYVDNLCQGLILAAARAPGRGEVYWVADRRPYPMNEVVGTVERLLADEFGLPCAGRRLRLPGLVAGAAGRADAALQRLGLYHQKIHVLSEMNKTIACAVAAARRDLGYDPAVDLEEGMRRSLRWVLAQGIAV